MKRMMKKTGMIVATFVAIGLTMNFTGCSKENSIGPELKKSNENIAESNIGKIKILSAKTDLSLAKGAADSVFTMEKFITRRDGGELVLGNKYYGNSRITFDPFDLPRNTTIQFEWAATGTFMGMLNSLEFGPHGTVFNKPVRVALSYRTADLTGVDENKLQMFYFNEETGIWELIGGRVDTEKKKIIVQLKHFSRYALAHSE
jgi:hypothetical protein